MRRKTSIILMGLNDTFATVRTHSMDKAYALACQEEKQQVSVAIDMIVNHEIVESCL